MKKILLFLGIFISSNIYGFFVPVFATSSKYTGEIDSCMEARAPGGKGAKSIEDYICPVTVAMSYQEVVLQVIMSKEFNVLDKQIKTDLKKIYDGGNKDIGQLATNIRDLFDSSNNEAIYPLQYAKICNKTTVNEASLYFTEKEASLTTDNIQKFLYGQKTGDIQYLSCQELVNKKLIAYKESAWLLGESALVKSFLNDKHTYIRKLKDQYEKFLNKWTIYVGQLGVIKDKWPSKTKKVQ